MIPPFHAHRTIEAVFRRESGRIIASLIRISGSFDAAEDALQEALTAALASWPTAGIPQNPAAWLMAAAQRKSIDAVRRERTRREKQDAVAYESRSAQEPATGDEMSDTYPDDRLRLFFTCCHPALNGEAQVALTLRTLSGLTTAEIARAFLLPEPTLAQRLVRAKAKIREANIPYAIPRADALNTRLESVQAVVYLIFNEGYAASSGDALIRRELCAEAIRLARLLCDLIPDEAGSLGLLALLLLQDSRRNARTDSKGRLVLLADQDRAIWDRAEIDEGLRLVERSLRMGPPGIYALQAAIAAVHATAPSAAETDWTEIAALYAVLLQIHPSPVVMLNRAVAVAMSEGPAQGLALIDELSSRKELARYHLLHAARADLLRRLGRNPEAAEAYRAALALVRNDVERDYLRQRLNEVS